MTASATSSRTTRIAFLGLPPDNDSSAGLSVRTQHNIIRRNVLYYNDSSGVALSADGGTTTTRATTTSTRTCSSQRYPALDDWGPTKSGLLPRRWVDDAAHNAMVGGGESRTTSSTRTSCSPSTTTTWTRRSSSSRATGRRPATRASFPSPARPTARLRRLRFPPATRQPVHRCRRLPHHDTNDGADATVLASRTPGTSPTGPASSRAT